MQPTPTVVVPDETVPDQLDHAALLWPDRIAVDFLRATLDYRELAHRVSRAARTLADLGVRRGDRVALAMPNCTTHVVVFYAVLRLGAIVVEHNPTYTAAQLRHQLADSGAGIAVVWSPLAADALAARDGTDLRTVVSVDVSADLPRASRLALRLPVRAARQTRAGDGSTLLVADTAIGKVGGAICSRVPDSTIVRVPDSTRPSTGFPQGATGSKASSIRPPTSTSRKSE